MSVVPQKLLLLCFTILIIITYGCFSNKNESYKSPLHDAVCKGDLKKINQLIDEGADINYQDDTSDATPLHVAVFCNQESAAELLIDRGAEIDKQGVRIVGTPLFVAAYRGNNNIAKLLIAKGADVNAKINDKSTPLHEAAFRGHVSMAKLLIDNGADEHVKEVIRNYKKIVWLRNNWLVALRFYNKIW